LLNQENEDVREALRQAQLSRVVIDEVGVPAGFTTVTHRVLRLCS
jgi:hypothetical protein